MWGYGEFSAAVFTVAVRVCLVDPHTSDDEPHDDEIHERVFAAVSVPPTLACAVVAVAWEEFEGQPSTTF